MEEKFKFYNKDEIEQILRTKQKLVYADSGNDEVVLRYKDLPDFIVDVNNKCGLINLKIYDYHNVSMTPIVTTNGEYLNKCDSKVREDIFERLVYLQLGGEINKYKLINERDLEDAKKELSRTKKSKDYSR